MIYTHALNKGGLGVTSPWIAGECQMRYTDPQYQSCLRGARACVLSSYPDARCPAYPAQAGPHKRCSTDTGGHVTDRFSQLLAVWETGLVIDRALAEEIVGLAPAGTFSALPRVADLGVSDVLQFQHNTNELSGRHRRAIDSGCYLEVIALRTQHMELWLRMYWVVKNQKGKVFGPRDELTFGQVIGLCAQAGLQAELVDDLRAFNQVRNDALHNYFLGDIEYEGFREAAIDHQDLDSRVVDCVTQEIARPATADDLIAGMGAAVLVQRPFEARASGA